MVLFGREKEEFRRQFLKLENGLPSHDTFSRVFRLLDPESFGACFQKFMGKFSAARHDAHGRQLAATAMEYPPSCGW